MEDLKKIQEFFSKPLNEATFKVGDKVTYLGHPGIITAVRKTPSGDTTYSVAYDKGFGRTKASDIYNKGGEIKLAEATKDEETKFHTKLDKLVHDTFGKRKGEMEEGMGNKDREQGLEETLVKKVMERLRKS